MRWKTLILTLLILPVSGQSGVGRGEECTTAVISGGATADSRPILWKNRDTDTRSNMVVYVQEQPYSYLAVVNAGNSSGRVVWGGLNAAGFAIINSVSYNLPQRGGENADLEGFVMADVLRTCVTIYDFERYLKTNLGPDLGSRTNFCVIDAQGGAAIFETHNHGYTRLDAGAPPDRYLLNTNFSRSGTADQGAGYLRFDRETELFRGVKPGSLTHEFILQDVARDLGHSLERHPPRAAWKQLPAGTPYWIHANYTINRISTASSILIHGVGKGEDPAHATLWVILGEPVCSIASPLWVAAGQPPVELHDSADAPIARESLRLKGLLRPLKGRDREEYVDLTKLDNASGTGWLPANLELERKIIVETKEFLGHSQSPTALSEFERSIARRVYKRLQEIR